MPFPPDTYTPHGYLDTPTHTRNLTPRGVLRSYDLGFRWHYPAHAGMYGGRHETYRAGFRIAVDGALGLQEYALVSSPYHSKNLFVFELAVNGARGRAEFVLVGEHTIAAQIELRGARRLDIVITYERLIAANGAWGESGLVGRRTGDGLALQSFEDGDAFVFGASQQPAAWAITPDPAQAAAWCRSTVPDLAADQSVTVIGARGEMRALSAVASFDPAPAGIVDLLLTRGPTLRHAKHRLDVARRTLALEQRHKREDDDRFWSTAPRLNGDWPAHWRRGLVYDHETLRMMVRQPAGIYRHSWDAMQIQAPRVVLAEAAMDALAISYADPRRAQHMLLGTFLDASAANVPCSREDGSYNMVAADGTVCGTAPSWGYPLLVVAHLAALRPDPVWLAALYPALNAHLTWWIGQRTDSHGRLFYACSWEAGQDDSPRFGDQPLGGGHPVRHIQPVDLYAALAHACGVMADLAHQLGKPVHVAQWTQLAGTYTHALDGLWTGERYADNDTLRSVSTTIQDPMHLAPAALGVADPARHAALRTAIAAIDADTLIWPPPAWTVIAAADALTMHNDAGAVAASICERVYSFWDARQPRDGQTLPGIACEYWPLDGRCGGEGYGWGAFTIHLLLRYVLGLSITAEHLVLRPYLPPAWRIAGRRYGVSITLRGREWRIGLAVSSTAQLVITIDTTEYPCVWGEPLTVAFPS